VDNIFRGAHRSVVVDCDGARMKVETTGTWHADVGAELTIAADPNHVWALRA